MPLLDEGTVVVEQVDVARTRHGADGLGIDGQACAGLTHGGVEVEAAVALGHPVNVVLRVHHELKYVGLRSHQHQLDRFAGP